MSTNDIFAPYEKEGRSSIILTGRSIYDYECREDGTISTIVKLMAEYAKDIHLAMIRYSLADGLIVPYSMYQKNDSESIKKALSSYGISNTKCASGDCKASQELVDILRGISKITSESNADLKWQDSQPMKFLFLFEFTSDIMPNSSSVNQLVARELIYQLAFSRSFLESGNLLMLTDVIEGKIDSQIQGLIYQKFLPYPNFEEKLVFIKGLHQKYPNAKYAPDLNDQVIANLSSSTPNRSLDLIFRSSHLSGSPIEAKGLIEQKTKDIQTISEGTLTMLDTSRVKNVQLKGENIRNPMIFLDEQSNGLRTRSKFIHTNILLMGAPGTGKTDLAYRVSQNANAPIFQLNSPKAGIVGETERRSALQARIFTSTAPSIGFIDEITEAMPMQRTQNLDSGASDAVMQALLNALSDNSREGKSMLIATTNCGFKMGSAMRDRFVVVPVIMPSLEDFPAIICSIAQQVSGSTLNENDAEIIEASKLFYAKHLMPRRIRVALKLACKVGGLTAHDVLMAAQDANPLDEASWSSAIYADLCAIVLTASRKLLPWYGREKSYPFPEYIKNVLDNNYEVDPAKLNKEINRLQPYVNV